MTPTTSMNPQSTGDLDGYLKAHANGAAPRAIAALAGAACAITMEIRAPKSRLDAEAGDMNAGGEAQKALDVIADDIVLEALRGTGVRAYLSEERDAAVGVDADGEVIVACDPLDGSSNIGVNMSVGTIFSIWPASAGELVRGRAQIAAGFFVYGPQTTLLLTTGSGTASFRMDERGGFSLLDDALAIPHAGREFAINASNSRHWPEPVRIYIDECLAGRQGPRGADFNMRWAGALVADAWRIFDRGGIFLYPGDSREGYGRGRLRLVYEAAPVAFLVEQAGGMATDGLTPVMDVMPDALHARTPLIFGSRDEVERVAAHCRAAGAN